MTPLRLRTYELPDYDRREILRYAGYPPDAADALPLLERCLAEADGCFRGTVCFRECPVTAGDTLDLSFLRTESAALRKNLAGCGRAVIFAATVGLGIDRLIARYSRLSPVTALMMQAVGAERIESLCDTFCRDLLTLYPRQKPRFSPGYGDLPLECQREFFAVLDCPRSLGLTLNESLLMSPSKSVTAIIGIEDTI